MTCSRANSTSARLTFWPVAMRPVARSASTASATCLGFHKSGFVSASLGGAGPTVTVAVIGPLNAMSSYTILCLASGDMGSAELYVSRWREVAQRMGAPSRVSEG